MIKLEKIKANDFLSFQELNLDLSAPGLYLISGFNEETGDSNGSGKSSVLSIISWVLFGTTHKGLSVPDVIRWGASTCKASLEMSDGSTKYNISRTPTTVSLKINGEKLQGKKTDIQTSINEVFKTNYYQFIRSLLFSQGQAEFLGQSSDSDKKKLFRTIFGLDRIDKAYQVVRSRLNNETLIADKSANEISLNDSMLLKFEQDLGRYKALMGNSISTEEERIASIIKKKEELKPVKPENNYDSIRTLEELMAKFRPIDQIQTEFLILEDNNREASISIGIAESKFTEIKMSYSNLENVGSKCRMCGSEITEETISKHRLELEELARINIALIKNLSLVRESNNAKMTELNNSIIEHEKLKNTIREAKLQITSYEFHLSRWEEYCKSIDEEVEKIKNSSTVDAYGRIIEDTDNKINLTKSSIELASADFELAKKKIDVYEFLRHVLSKDGVSAKIITKAFARLEDVANSYLSRVSHEKMSIEIFEGRDRYNCKKEWPEGKLLGLK